MRILLVILIAVVIYFINGSVFAADKSIRFDFEGTSHDWIIPDWAYYQSDHKGKITNLSTKQASKGKSSLEVTCEFPGDVWTAVLVERKGDEDLSDYNTISMDVYVPKGAPKAFLKGRIILTISEGWYFTEMRRSVYLKPGRWTTIKAKLDTKELKEGERSDWKGKGDKSLYKHIHDVRKIALRIEYDAAPPHRIGPKYRGPIYIDNVVIK